MPQVTLAVRPLFYKVTAAAAAWIGFHQPKFQEMSGEGGFAVAD
jgi:hypothetical protein